MSQFRSISFFSNVEPNKEIFRINSNGSLYLVKSPEEIGDIFGEHKPAQVDIQANEIVTREELTEDEDTSSVSQLLVRFVSANRPPQFKVTEPLVGHIDEHSAPHSAIVWEGGDLAQVLDLDQGLNGTIELELIDPGGTFTIEPSAAYRQAHFTLLVNQSALLDFETKRNISVMVCDCVLTKFHISGKLTFLQTTFTSLDYSQRQVWGGCTHKQYHMHNLYWWYQR